MLTLVTSFKCILTTAIKTPYYKYFGNSEPRGFGVELRLFNLSLDKSVELTNIEQDGQVIKSATDKEYGLREAFLLDSIGFC